TSDRSTTRRRSTPASTRASTTPTTPTASSRSTRRSRRPATGSTSPTSRTSGTRDQHDFRARLGERRAVEVAVLLDDREAGAVEVRVQLIGVEEAQRALAAFRRGPVEARVGRLERNRAPVVVLRDSVLRAHIGDLVPVLRRPLFPRARRRITRLEHEAAAG